MSVNLKYRILGIDPGTNYLGFSILEVDGKRLDLIKYGAFKMNNLNTHQEKLNAIFTRVTNLITSYGPEELAIEAPFFGKNVQSMLKLGRAQGVAMAAGLSRQIPITEYSPKKISKFNLFSKEFSTHIKKIRQLNQLQIDKILFDSILPINSPSLYKS